MGKISSIACFIAIFYTQLHAKEVTISAPKGSIVAEVVQTKETRALGLGNRAGLEPGHGMLFKYHKPKKVCIWMKNMQFPIDVVWLSQEKRVVQVKLNFEPETFARGEQACAGGSMYVIEVAAGEAERLGLLVGTQVQFSP